MLTACGIETLNNVLNKTNTNLLVVATVLTACGIETLPQSRLVSLHGLVATVLTACGIETFERSLNFNILYICCNSAYRLRYWNGNLIPSALIPRPRVATVLTACGIETHHMYAMVQYNLQYVATVLTACGIETSPKFTEFILFKSVATVLTACGIETL